MMRQGEPTSAAAPATIRPAIAGKRQRAVRHHQRAGHVVSADAVRMPGEEVEASVADAVLLPQVAGDIFAPAVHAQRLAAEDEPMSGRREPVAQIVVAAVAERLVEQADLVQRARAIGGVPGADVIDFVTANATVALLEIAAHHPGPEAGVRRCVIVALRGGYRRIVERLEQVREPAGARMTS